MGAVDIMVTLSDTHITSTETVIKVSKDIALTNTGPAR